MDVVVVVVVVAAAAAAAATAALVVVVSAALNLCRLGSGFRRHFLSYRGWTRRSGIHFNHAGYLCCNSNCM